MAPVERPVSVPVAVVCFHSLLAGFSPDVAGNTVPRLDVQGLVTPRQVCPSGGTEPATLPGCQAGLVAGDQIVRTPDWTSSQEFFRRKISRHPEGAENFRAGFFLASVSMSTGKIGQRPIFAMHARVKKPGHSKAPPRTAPGWCCLPTCYAALLSCLPLSCLSLSCLSIHAIPAARIWRMLWSGYSACTSL